MDDKTKRKLDWLFIILIAYNLVGVFLALAAILVISFS